MNKASLVKYSKTAQWPKQNAFLEQQSIPLQEPFSCFFVERELNWNFLLYIKNVKKIKNLIWPKTLSRKESHLFFLSWCFSVLMFCLWALSKIREICPPVCQHRYTDDKTETTTTREHTRMSGLFLLLKPCMTFAKEYRTWYLGINHRRIC